MHPQSGSRSILRGLAFFLTIAALALIGGFVTLGTNSPALAAPDTHISKSASEGNDGGNCQPWSFVNVPNPRTHHYLRDIDPLAPNDIWAVGEYYDQDNYTADTALAMHWDGTAWSITPTPKFGERPSLNAVAAIAPDDVWAVGVCYCGGPYETLTMHWDGTAWSRVASPSPPGGTELNDVVALTPNDVWAVGANDGFHETITMHWDGSAWTIVNSPNGGNFSDDNVLTSVSAVSANDIWAVGYIYPKGGTPTTLSIHWNGSQWSLVNTPNPGNYSRRLDGVSALAANDVWAVGSYSANAGKTYVPLFLHWNGTQWQHVASPEFGDYNSLEAVHAIAPNDVWAVGTTAGCNFCAFETLTMHWDGTAWTQVFSPNGFRTFSRLRGVTATSSGDVWAVGFSDESAFPYTSDSLIMRRVCPTATPTGTPPTGTPTTVAPTVTRTATAALSPTASVTPAPPSITANPTSVPTGTQPVVATGTPSAVVSATSPPGTTTPTVCAISFTDVPANNTFYANIRCLACRGILGGYSDGTFRPNNDITRGQIAKVVSNAAGFNESAGEQIYEDVPPSNTFYAWVNRLSRRGHMGGYNCGGPGEPCGTDNRPYFRPNANATRGQLAKIVASAAQITGTPTGQRYADVPPDSTFYVWIEQLSALEVIGGYACGSVPTEPCDDQNRPYFRPFNNVTRGQASKIVANTFFPTCQVRE